MGFVENSLQNGRVDVLVIYLFAEVIISPKSSKISHMISFRLHDDMCESIHMTKPVVIVIYLRLTLARQFRSKSWAM